MGGVCLLGRWGRRYVLLAGTMHGGRIKEGMGLSLPGVFCYGSWARAKLSVAGGACNWIGRIVCSS